MSSGQDVHEITTLSSGLRGMKTDNDPVATGSLSVFIPLKPDDNVVIS